MLVDRRCSKCEAVVEVRLIEPERPDLDLRIFEWPKCCDTETLEYAVLDPRAVIIHSTRVLVGKDRRGTKAAKLRREIRSTSFDCRRNILSPSRH